jgi:murein DD-endopeptidase MepM/ murein hydrolase activator NlpD
MAEHLLVVLLNFHHQHVTPPLKSVDQGVLMSRFESKNIAVPGDAWAHLNMTSAITHKVRRHVLLLLMLGLVFFVGRANAVSTSDWDQRTNGFNFVTYGWSNPLPDILTRTLAQPFFSSHYFVDGRKHLGTDLMAAAGTMVFSLCQGRILESKDFTYQRNSGRSKYLSYFNSRVTVQCSHSQGDFLAIYMHVDGALVAAGDSVQAGQQIARLTETFDEFDVRTTANDHLHFGINSDRAFAPPVTAGGVTFNGYGIAPANATIAQANQAGFFDPFSFLSTRLGTGSASTALTFHGAGSLINPTSLQTKVCDSFGGWGCYRDEIRLHADGSTPLGVFQVGRDSSYCTQVNLQLVATAGASMPVQNVKIRLGPWNDRSVDVEYTISLPATIPLLNTAWNLLAVQFPSPISQQAKLLAICAGSGGGLYPTASASRAPANSRGIDLANGYSWTGNGSAISRSGGSVQFPFGNTQDWAKMHSFSGNGTGGTFFQWQKSVACPRVMLSARTDSGHYRIRIRAWDSAPSAAFALEGVYLSASSSWSPSASLVPLDNYYLIYVYPQPASASAATHDLELKCQ